MAHFPPPWIQYYRTVEINRPYTHTIRSRGVKAICHSGKSEPHYSNRRVISCRPLNTKSSIHSETSISNGIPKKTQAFFFVWGRKLIITLKMQRFQAE